jgi:hypothetical protein
MGYCGNLEIVGAGFDDCRWKENRIFYRNEVRRLNGISDQIIRDSFRRACQLWMNVANLELIETEGENWNFHAINHKFDGNNGVLADSAIPCNLPQSVKLNQRYDESDIWTELKYYLTVVHEVGHMLGIPHITKPGNIMNPSLQMHLNGLGPDDTAEITKRYGRRSGPVPGPTPPPIVPPGNFPDVLGNYITWNGKKYVAVKLTRGREIGLPPTDIWENILVGGPGGEYYYLTQDRRRRSIFDRLWGN